MHLNFAERKPGADISTARMWLLQFPMAQWCHFILPVPGCSIKCIHRQKPELHSPLSIFSAGISALGLNLTIDFKVLYSLLRFECAFQRFLHNCFILRVRIISNFDPACLNLEQACQQKIMLVSLKGKQRIHQHNFHCFVFFFFH